MINNLDSGLSSRRVEARRGAPFPTKVTAATFENLSCRDHREETEGNTVDVTDDHATAFECSTKGEHGDYTL